MADLVAEMAEHRPVRLAEPYPQRLAVVVKRFDEVDGDDAVGVADDYLLAGAVAGQQVERQSAVAPPERVDRQADVVELVDEAAQAPPRWGPASRAPTCHRRRARGGSASAPGSDPVRRATAPRARASCSPTFRLVCSAPTAAHQQGRRRRLPAALTSSAGGSRARCGRWRTASARTRRSHCTPGRRMRAWAIWCHVPPSERIAMLSGV